jgi:hypothetical protein
MNLIGKKRKSNLAMRFIPFRKLFYFSSEEGKNIATLKSITLERPREVKIHSDEILITQAIGSYKFNELELMSIKESIKGEACRLIGIKEENYKFNIILIEK